MHAHSPTTVRRALLGFAPFAVVAPFFSGIAGREHVPSNLLASLNESQRRAAEHVEGPLLVLAGPGSGKTRVVTHRVARLVAAGIPAGRIVALTFTNKAADEMRRRVEELVGPSAVEMGTFHRFAARLLRRHARLVGLTSEYSILDADDAHAMLKRAAKKLNLSLTHTPIDRIAAIVSRAKNDLLTPETFEPRWGRPTEEVAQRIWPIYQDLMLRANSVDFDDLLVHVARLLAENQELRAELDARHRFILVDEYQDTNAVQYCILRGLSLDHPNLAVTGDPDQAIYGWRGASIRNILEFERDYPAAVVVTLEENYRSTANILGTADRLIAHNSRRKPKRLLTAAAPGALVRIVLDSSGHDEADRIAAEIAAAVAAGRRAPRDFAVLFRTNALSRSLEVGLRGRGIPYQLVRGLEFFQRREIRDVVAWLRLLRNPRDDEAMLRVVNVPPRGIGRQSLERLAAWAEDRRLSRLDAAATAADIPGLPTRAARALVAFARLHGELAAAAGRLGAVAPLIEEVLARTGYRAHLAAAAEEEDTEVDRVANVDELVTAARQFDDTYAADPGAAATIDPLGGFLETTALVGDTDAWDATSDRVALMTFHAAKGLEFPVVYMIAMEDGILPHERCLDHPEQLEEERRLVFVGITRGREEVHASSARMRDYRGTCRVNPPSLFLAEMTGSETIVTGTEAPEDGGAFAAAPFGNMDAVDCDDVAQDIGHRPAGRAVQRPDGLVLEMEDAPPPVRPRRRVDAVIERAADLAERMAGKSPAATFVTGQRVSHSSHGTGTISGISGAGPRAVATVIFDGPAGTRKFILGHGGLAPLD
jgi:DNA helicase-2/ATP-dependent DNA helicase PcrA